MPGNGLTKRQALDRTVLLIRRTLGLDEALAGQVVDSLCGVSACVIADSANLDSHAGQTCLVTLVQLVQAMGCTVKLLIPEMPLSRPQPPLKGAALRAALVAYGTDSMPESSLSLVTETSQHDLVFVIGDSPFNGPSKHAWRLVGGPWWGATTSISGPAIRWTGDFPVGAAVAASIATAEPFKVAVRSLITDLKPTFRPAEQFDLTSAARVDWAADGH